MNYKTYITLLAAPALVLSSYAETKAISLIDECIQIEKDMKSLLVRVNSGNAKEIAKELSPILKRYEKCSSKLKWISYSDLPKNKFSEFSSTRKDRSKSTVSVESINAVLANSPHFKEYRNRIILIDTQVMEFAAAYVTARYL